MTTRPRPARPGFPALLAPLAAATAVLLAVTAIAGCAPPEKETVAGASGAATASSAADLGGLDALVAEAEKEGQLNVIALPPDWANYGAMITAFESKYRIKVHSAQPDAASQDEINAARQQKGKSSAPDVFDLGQSVALANTALFAPYKVATWGDIPEHFKDPDGKWVNDYGGFMSIGYDSAKLPAVAEVDDLLKPEFRGMVALNGDPTQAGAAFSGVVMASLSQGGSADDIAPGVEFFHKLKEAGNFLPVDPTPATIQSGQTPVVIDWNYLNGVQSEKMPSWRVVVPHDAAVASFYYQAINADAPHPAAARLWQEFVFSDQGQNLFAVGGVRPVRADAMITAGTLDKAAFDKMPAIDGPVTILTEAQSKAAAKYLADNWAKAIG
jgi:putative spermidine/putrescine transport system substrate-binding protein